MCLMFNILFKKRRYCTTHKLKLRNPIYWLVITTSTSTLLLIYIWLVLIHRIVDSVLLVAISILYNCITFCNSNKALWSFRHECWYNIILFISSEKGYERIVYFSIFVRHCLNTNWTKQGTYKQLFSHWLLFQKP